MLALFLNAVHEIDSPADIKNSLYAYAGRLSSLLGISRDTVRDSSQSCLDIFRFMSTQSLFRDYDELFRRFQRRFRLNETSQAWRLKIKSECTVVQPWPIRLKNGASQRDFEILLASGHDGSERYVKWERAA